MSAKKIEDQVVDCIRKMGSDPALQEEALRKVQAEQKRQSSALKAERKALLPKLRLKHKQVKNLNPVMGGNGRAPLPQVRSANAEPARRHDPQVQRDNRLGSRLLAIPGTTFRFAWTGEIGSDFVSGLSQMWPHEGQNDHSSIK